ncbi:hypothetical protein [Natronorubrum halophilum]|uniref:hypothetical protein n=1 Tax=Natronorubrum halophilum TaxID=1702106 RepID=UPI0010C2272B|nr:hypothetical protein [Natronorubrum halophilum]
MQMITLLTLTSDFGDGTKNVRDERYDCQEHEFRRFDDTTVVVRTEDGGHVSSGPEAIPTNLFSEGGARRETVVAEGVVA